MIVLIPASSLLNSTILKFVYILPKVTLTKASPIFCPTLRSLCTERKRNVACMMKEQWLAASAAADDISAS